VFAVVGEALLDMVQPVPGGSYTAIPGGGPLNIAIGLQRLGCPTQMLARFSTGAMGRLVREHAERNGLGLDHSVWTDDLTTLAFASLDPVGRASYDFYVHGTADWGWRPSDLASLPSSAQAIHSGSVAAFLQPGADVILDAWERERAAGTRLVSFDPNVRPALVGARADAVDRVERFVRASHVVKASDEDLEWLYPQTDSIDALERWASSGPALVVMTRGPDGCLAYLANGDAVAVSGVPVEVVDTIGAGDSFESGLLSGIADAGFLDPRLLPDLDVETVRSVLGRAVTVSAMTCQRVGANPPTRAELEAAIAAGSAAS
jgi:fructokinase